MTFFVWLLIVALAALLIGFASGRRLGQQSGVAHGRALARIELREQSLRQGRCPICDESR